MVMMIVMVNTVCWELRLLYRANAHLVCLPLHVGLLFGKHYMVLVHLLLSWPHPAASKSHCHTGSLSGSGVKVVTCICSMLLCSRCYSESCCCKCSCAANWSLLTYKLRSSRHYWYKMTCRLSWGQLLPPQEIQLWENGKVWPALQRFAFSDCFAVWKNNSAMKQ